jgi:multicomponent Na+:H+ antiporter subunit A
LIALLVLHALVGVAVFGSGGRLGRWCLAIAAIAPAATLIWLATQASTVLDGGDVESSVDWVPALGISGSFRLDGFGFAMVLLIAGIGLAVLGYSASYFGRTSEGLGRLAGLLTLFAGAMLGVVLADDVVVLFTAWELTSITSYLLIGNDHTRTQARAAALHALLITSAGGLAMLAGLVLIAQAGGTYRLSELLASPPSGTSVTVGLVLVAVGAFTKSAQYPFHSWLPGAMAAPTPVSAYLHSATMVKAGVYLIGRLAPAFAEVGPWRPLVIAVGMTTMIGGGLRALRQYDLKLLLAHGTVSQLGFLVVLFGVGIPEATTAGVVMLLAHGAFKATLFMVVGMLDHQTGTRDMRLLPPLGAGWRPAGAVAVVAAASMAGVPLLGGFIGKEAAYEAVAHSTFGGHDLLLAAIVVGSALTFAYSARFLWGAFLLPRRLLAGTEGVAVPHPDRLRSMFTTAKPPAWAFVMPAIVLAATAVLTGIAPAVLDRITGAAAGALDADVRSVHLALWHGLNLALWLSLLTYAIGIVLFVERRHLARILAAGEAVSTGTEVYLRTLRALNRVANRVTAIVQNGSLPIYAGVILLTAAALPGVVLLTSADWPGWPQVAGSPAQWPIVAVLTGAAIAASVTRRRFSAALFLGTVGYAMAALFVVQGAPDLALTQAAIETLTTVIFVLVLRRLPDRFERRSTPLTRTLRIVISVGVAVFVFAFALIARGSRTAEPVSTQMIEQSLSEGKGRNVVNVILVDFRGFDTLGEITVLAAAAIGAVALARVGRRAAAAPGKGGGR